jgi:hypothetical protein
LGELALAPQTTDRPAQLARGQIGALVETPHRGKLWDAREHSPECSVRLTTTFTLKGDGKRASIFIISIQTTRKVSGATQKAFTSFKRFMRHLFETPDRGTAAAVAPMLLALDKDACLYVFDSVSAAESNLEAIDIENGEYELCDELGQPYLGELIRPGVGFRIVPQGSRDAFLPLSFINRTKHFWSKGTPFDSIDDARAYFSR